MFYTVVMKAELVEAYIQADTSKEAEQTAMRLLNLSFAGSGVCIDVKEIEVIEHKN